MELQIIEEKIVEYLQAMFPDLCFTGTDYKNVKKNPYIIQVFKFKGFDEYEVSVVRYNSDPKDKNESESMNKVYNALLYCKDLIVSSKSTPPYRNFIGKYDEKCGYYVYEDSRIFQFRIIFNFR